MSRPIASESGFRAIADPTRRRILDFVRRHDTTPGDIAQSLQLRPTTLSFHLRVLESTGLLVQRRTGRQRRYRLDARLLRQVLSWLRHYEKTQ